MEEGNKLGFGAVLINEAEELRRKFEVDMKGDLKTVRSVLPLSRVFAFILTPILLYLTVLSLPP